MYWAFPVRQHKTQNIAEKNGYWGEEQRVMANSSKQ